MMVLPTGQNMATAVSDSSTPRISAIIPAHNGERYLDEAIESVLAQSVPVIEIIVVDDGSTDNTARIAMNREPLIRYFWQPASGAAAARNRGVSLAAGNFLAFLDADDRWVNNKLQRQIAAFTEDPTLDMVFGHVRQLHDGKEWENGILEPVCPPSELIAGIVPGTILVRRDSFLRVGILRIDYKLVEFIDWYMRAVEMGIHSKMLPDLLLWRRIHGSNLGIRERSNVSDYARILKAGLDRRRSAD